MAFDESPGCEPLRVWGRLEPRARQVDFDSALQARIHDPLWLLARQWQFGEFKGEDTGSPILTRIARRLTPVTGVLAGGVGFDTFDNAVPLEALVERLPIDWRSPTRRSSAGRHFLALLADHAQALPANAAPFKASYYLALFARVFPISVATLNETDPANALAIARRNAEARAHRVLAALAGRAVDGHALALAIPAVVTWNDLPGQLAIDVLPDHQEVVLKALEAYRSWFVALHVEPHSVASCAWVPEQVEYQFECALPRDGKTMVLSADAYTSGRLDWYAFDQSPLTATAQAGVVETDVKTVIPTPAEFAGMPNSRWWQFEDSAVDLGTMRADVTDIAKLMVAEFALLFSNNWFIVPYRQPVGSLAEIDGIVVTDVFGWRTQIGPATGSSDGVWTRWDYFSLAARSADGSHAPLGQHLLLPPALSHTVEGEPFESVAFIRDEMANMVWAVETQVPDGDGGRRDGSAYARQLRNALGELARTLAPAVPSIAADAPLLRYQLGNTVPENWIPFLPVHKPDDTRSIRLQRASMPRFFLDGVTPVRPLTSILRDGLRDADETQEHAFYVNEEEVPRSGICIEGTLQRARWFGGQTFLWHGRRVTLGRGEGGSGLRFDIVEPQRTG